MSRLTLLLLTAALFGGCASTGTLRLRSGPPRAPEHALHDVLDRWQSWESLGGQTKISVKWNGRRLSTRGHLLYLIGERYEIGFRQVHGSQIGNLYVTPVQTIYWDDRSRPRTLTPRDTASVGRMLNLDLPEWDPRDLLPFPVSGRTGGFQVDSISSDGADALVYGSTEFSRHTLRLSGPRRIVTEERVERPGRAPIVKRYSRIRDLHGWPVARRVLCSAPDGSAAVAWSLHDLVLRASPPPAAVADSSTHSNSPRP